MSKDFDSWNKTKKILEYGKSSIFHESEIWWASIGINVGAEEDGKNMFFERPIFILKKYSKDIFLGIPMTSKYKNNKYHHRISEAESSTLLLSQIKLMSAKRLKRMVSKVSRGKYKIIREKLLDII